MRSNLAAVRLCASTVVYWWYIVMVVLFGSELSCSTIFWDLTNTFEIYTITVVYLILAECVIYYGMKPCLDQDWYLSL